MQRSKFIKSLVGLGALSLVNPLDIKQYEKVYLKQCFVRGFSYYKGPEMIDSITKSGHVELVREPENEYDSRAIAIHFNGAKIGYLPRESNKTLSILMDTQLLTFHAEITHIEKDVNDWEKIRIAVYALKEIQTSEDLNIIAPYTVLTTPKYYSFPCDDDTVLRVLRNDDLEMLLSDQLEDDEEYEDDPDFTQDERDFEMYDEDEESDQIDFKHPSEDEEQEDAQSTSVETEFDYGSTSCDENPYEDLNESSESTGDATDEEDFRYILVGNIIDQHYWGEQKEIRSGTKHFSRGTKLFLFPEYGGDGHVNIPVRGLSRRKKMINVTLRARYIKNVRVKKTFNPMHIKMIDEGFFYDRVTLDDLQRFAASMNESSIEIKENEQQV